MRVEAQVELDRRRWNAPDRKRPGCERSDDACVIVRASTARVQPRKDGGSQMIVPTFSAEVGEVVEEHKVCESRAAWSRI